jgi:hypothetical protein
VLQIPFYAWPTGHQERLAALSIHQSCIGSGTKCLPVSSGGTIISCICASINPLTNLAKRTSSSLWFSLRAFKRRSAAPAPSPSPSTVSHSFSPQARASFYFHKYVRSPQGPARFLSLWSACITKPIQTISILFTAAAATTIFFFNSWRGRPRLLTFLAWLHQDLRLK